MLNNLWSVHHLGTSAETLSLVVSFGRAFLRRASAAVCAVPGYDALSLPTPGLAHTDLGGRDVLVWEKRLLFCYTRSLNVLNFASSNLYSRLHKSGSWFPEV